MQFEVDHSGDMKAILDFLGLKNNTMKKMDFWMEMLKNHVLHLKNLKLG